MALACTVQPIPKAASAVKKAKSTAIHFQPSPFSRAYIGPPSILPFFVFTRYLMASKPSAYFVEIPNTPVSQHHSTAPGPPRAIAVATPTILPVPMVAASAVASEPNCDTSPVASGSFCTDSLIALKMWRWGHLNLMVRNRCVPSSRMIIGHPQSMPFTSVKISFSCSISPYSLFTFYSSLLTSHSSNLILTFVNPIDRIICLSCSSALCSAACRFSCVIP